METRKNTSAGVLFWTPAPVRTSPTSSVVSEDEDFVRQMDENGIIGLSEVLEDLELWASCCDSDAESNPNLYPGPLPLQEADPRGPERDTPEELSYNRSQHWSHNESQGVDVQIRSPFEDLLDRAEEQGMECVPQWDKYLDMTEEERDGEEAGTSSDRKRKKNRHPSTSRELGTTKGLAERSVSKREMEEISPTLYHRLAIGPATVSNHHCPISRPASPVTALSFPHLCHFTAEELAAPGIDAETLPEMSFTESPPESHRSHVSLKSSPRCAEVTLGDPLQPGAAVFSQEGVSNHHSGVNNGPLKASDKSGKPRKQPTPSPRKVRQPSPQSTYSSHRSLSKAKADSLKLQHRTASPDKGQQTPRAGTNAAEGDESRKGPLSYRTPDFSKVEPKVHFPKDGYNPPKSRPSSKRKSSSPEPPFVFKSPADNAKEVLLNTTAGAPASSDSYKPPTSAPSSPVPQEFRSRQQATTLLDQLEEDYNRLLTKYAEAENTIDRLRLAAKVNLYSDPPKPGHLVLSGPNRDTSKFMMLDFPPAQRAEFNSASPHQTGHGNHQRSSSSCPSTRSPDPQVGQQLAKILCNQAVKFLQQLQTFEDLLKQLGAFDQMKTNEVALSQGLSQLSEGLGSLERGYLLARDEHNVLQQHGAQISHFDSERELEGLIFQCGLRMDGLKEQVEQMQQEQPTCVAPPSPPPHPSPSSEGGETLTHPQSPPVPLLVDPGEAAAVSSASEESDEDEDTLDSLYLKPLNGKQRHVEQDFATLMDHFKELPKLLDQSQREGASSSAALRSDTQPSDEEKERRSHRAGDLEVQKSLPPRKDESDHLDSAPVRTVKQPASRSSSSSRRASSQSTTLHPLSSRRRLEVGKSHSSSLGEITALGKRNSKLQTGSSGVLLQDGIISPETDSGFVCSESSWLTPAAASSPLHQRASESVSGPQEANPGNPHTGPVSAPAPASSHSHAAMEPRSDSQLDRDQQRRTRQGQRRRTFSCSPQRCVRHTEQTRADSGTSEFGLESDRSHTVSEDRQKDEYTESINSLHNSSPSSSPAGRHHHDDSLGALSSSQAANHNDAIQRLQAEVTRLRERLESCVRNTTPLSSVRAAASAQESYTHHNSSPPRFRSGEQWDDVGSGRRDRRPVDEVEEATLRRTTRTRPPSAHRQKPQLDILTGSEPSSPNPQPLVSRCTQTSTAAPDSYCSHTSTVRSRTHPRQLLDVSEPADEPDSRGRRAPLCPQCLSHHQGRSEIGGDREPVHSYCCCCRPLCGRPEPSRSTEPDSHTHTSCHPCPLDRAVRSRHFAAAAPPALMQCMPVFPPPLLFYSSPRYVSPSHSTPSGVRTRRFQSPDQQHSVDTSLNRAIRAARHMKHTSGHMARSLATGVQYQEVLTQSCSY